MPGPNSPYTRLSSSQVLQQSFNESEDRLRVDAIATIESGTLEIVLDQADDSVAIGDGSHLFTSTNIAGKQGLDVNVINSTSTTVSGTVNTDVNGLNSFQTSQYSVGTSAVQITPSPLSGRSSLSVKVITTSNFDMIYIGNSSSVTISTGYVLFNGDSIQLDLTPAHQMWAIGTSPGQIVFALEIG